MIFASAADPSSALIFVSSQTGATPELSVAFTERLTFTH